MRDLKNPHQREKEKREKRKEKKRKRVLELFHCYASGSRFYSGEEHPSLELSVKT